MTPHRLHRRVLTALALSASVVIASPADSNPPPKVTPPADPARAPTPAKAIDTETPTRLTVTWEATRSATEHGGAGDSDPDRALRETLGRMLYARISIDADDRPLREVLTSVARSLKLNILPFYETKDRPAPLYGLVPTQRLSLYLDKVDGRTLLEAIAAQCGPDVTWQIQRGVVEFGPRATLAREDARSTKVYEVTDLAHEPPYFRRPDTNLLPVDKENDRGQLRLRPKDVIADLVRTISEQCEPDAFLPAPPPTEQEIAEGKKRLPMQHTAPATGSPNARRGTNSNATRNLDPEVGPIYVVGQWAQIHVKDATIVVTAPDFVHRAINGYPAALPPVVE